MEGTLMPINIYSKINNELMLIINKKSDITEDRTDLCPNDQFLQISTKKLNKPTSFKAHKHLTLTRSTDITQEAWIVLEGKIRAFFYDIDDTLLYETDLIAGDCAVVFKAGHSFEVIYDNTILYEVKNGPYFGQQMDKVFI
jgi:hypothetical protein